MRFYSRPEIAFISQYEITIGRLDRRCCARIILSPAYNYLDEVKIIQMNIIPSCSRIT